MICKCSIIVINDNSLWGKYVLRNADFRFGTPSRSHFLTHQVANHQENSWDIPFFLFLKLGISHLFRLSDFWDIPTFFVLQSWDIPTFSSIAQWDTFDYTQFVPHRFSNSHHKQKRSSVSNCFLNYCMIISRIVGIQTANRPRPEIFRARADH